MLKVHFLNVGHGDCTVIEHPSGRVTVIDINNGSELDPVTEAELLSRYGVSTVSAAFSKAVGQGVLSLLERAGYDIKLTNPIEFLHQLRPDHQIWRYVQTHPDMDHMRGLAALSDQFTVSNMWDVEHTKAINDFVRDSDRDDWNAYQRLRDRNTDTTVLKLRRGSDGQYWSKGDGLVDLGDGLEILAPTTELLRDAGDDSNQMSYVLRLTYAKRRIIFGGDASEAVWKDIVGRYGDGLKCDVLKASHHGRDSGYYQSAVAAMAPQYTIVSVGKKPDTDASDKYCRYSSNVWSTRWHGNITLTINEDGSGSVDPEYQRASAHA